LRSFDGSDPSSPLLKAQYSGIRLDDPSDGRAVGYVLLGAGQGTGDGKTYKDGIIFSMPKSRLEGIVKNEKLQLFPNGSVEKNRMRAQSSSGSTQDIKKTRS